MKRCSSWSSVALRGQKGVLRAPSRAFAEEKVFFVVLSGPSWTKRCSSWSLVALRGQKGVLRDLSRNFADRLVLFLTTFKPEISLTYLQALRSCRILRGLSKTSTEPGSCRASLKPTEEGLATTRLAPARSIAIAAGPHPQQQRHRQSQRHRHPQHREHIAQRSRQSKIERMQKAVRRRQIAAAGPGNHLL